VNQLQLGPTYRDPAQVCATSPVLHGCLMPKRGKAKKKKAAAAAAVTVKKEPTAAQLAAMDKNRDADCWVEPPRPADERMSMAVEVPASPFLGAGQSADAMCLAVSDPTLSFPHARCHCRRQGFEFQQTSMTFYPRVLGNGSSLMDQNKKHCESCYCYVCDCVASECKQWDTSSGPDEPQHCMASDLSQAWQLRRQQEREMRLENEEGLPDWMRGLPKEMAAPTPPSGYTSQLITPLVDAVATWPRRAGYAEFYMRRCIMHTVRRPLRPFRLPF
jgi:hypothetical protein